jgi:hypothetical protein
VLRRAWPGGLVVRMGDCQDVNRADRLPGRRCRVGSLLAAALLLSLLWAQALGTAGASSVAFDEPYHLASGYAYLRTGDPRLSTHQPALIDTWLAVPLLLLDLQLPLDTSSWQQGIHGEFGDVFMWQANPDQALRAVWLGRLANVALALLLGAGIFRWSGRLFGQGAGLLALALYALDPGIVANAALATNDLGVAAMLFAATWAWWKWLERPSRWRLLAAGLAAGAACASKSSGLIVGPVSLVLALLNRPAGGWDIAIVRRRLVGLIANGVICCLAIWAIYAFTTANGVPAPAYVEGIGFQSHRLAESLPVYALGRVRPDSVWFYYPLSFVLKTPLPILVLVGAGLVAAIRRAGTGRVWPLLTPPLLFGGMALASALQQGHRVLLPMLPFLACLGGAVVTGISWTRPRRPAVVQVAAVAVLVVWLALNGLLIYPHHLSFFNELAGGAANADFYLVDANLDWGQDLPALEEVMDQRGIPWVYLGYFGTAIPDLYGIEYWPAPGFLRFIEDAESRAFNPYTPEPGWYAISRTSLRQGLMPTHTDLYRYFWSRPVEARAGYSIDLYRVEYPSSMPVVRAVVQTARVADVSPELLGWREGERLIAKLIAEDETFIFAMSGPACYAVPDPLGFAPDLREAALRDARQHGEGVLEFDARQVVQPVLESWSGASPLFVPEGGALNVPVSFDGGLALVGYTLAQDSVVRGQELSLTLAWQVSGAVAPRFAAFVHVVGEDGTPVLQHDGWGSAVLGLETGDVVVQHVRIPVPDTFPTGSYRLQIGLYWQDTKVRWLAQTPGGTELDRVWLPEVEVQ